MRLQDRDYYHQALAGLIERVLRCRQGSPRVPQVADEIAMSRFHLGRLFQEVTGESLGHFLRRIRLERAAFALRTSDATVLEIAVDTGYSCAEALTRAFRAAFGVSPREFRSRRDLHWMLPGPTDLHWNPHWGADVHKIMPGVLSASVHYRPVRHAVVWRWEGNYSFLADGWKQFQGEMALEEPEASSRTYLTIYHDNLWTHPVNHGMRADLGWFVSAADRVPHGMRKVMIPAGLYAETDRFVARKERNDAWSYMTAKWYAARGKKEETVGMDEYAAWPLPFECSQTRIIVGLRGTGVRP
jgi:AraC family transcriptional regulator